jgi:SAM-dependent methyltransferase
MEITIAQKIEELKKNIESLRSNGISEEALNLAFAAGKKLVETYSLESIGGIPFNQGLDLVTLMHDFIGPIYQLNVLDIGCGSKQRHPDTSYKRDSYPDGWEPTIARTLAFAGAKVDGIDIGHSWNEPYNHIQANLLEKRLDDLLPKGKQYDSIITSCFFDSPSLWNLIEKLDVADFSRDLCKQIHERLKPNGIYFTSQTAPFARYDPKLHLKTYIGDVTEEYEDKIYDRRSNAFLRKIGFRQIPEVYRRVPYFKITSLALKKYNKNSDGGKDENL